MARSIPLKKVAVSSSAAAITLAWLVPLRWGAVVGQALTIAISAWILKLGLPLFPLSFLVLATAASNGAISLWLTRRPEVSTRTIGWVLLFDTLVLTALLYLSGGPSNPFSVLYLVHVTLAALVLGMRWAVGIVVLASFAFATLFFWHIPIRGLEHAHHGGSAFSIHLQGMWVAFTVAAALIAYFVAQLARSLREREAQLAEAEFARARSEKLASLSTLSAGAAHELGTPLSTIAVAAKELDRLITQNPERALDDARLIRAELERCHDILRRMSAQAGQTMGETSERITSSEVLARTCERLSPAQAERVERLPLTETELVCPIEGLTQVLVSLVQNALFASDASAKRVRLSAEVEQRLVRFVVEDSGAGVPPELLPRIGEPFFTTKPPGQGMGLGIFLATAFAERLGGRFVFTSKLNHGTRAAIELPLTESHARA